MPLSCRQPAKWIVLLALALAPWSSASAQPMSGSSGVAVLNDGRIFQGNITEVPGGYRVGTSDGHQLVLPFDQISVTSASMLGAYESLRDSMKKPSADGHLSLAEWCIVNGLWSQAYEQVQAALKLEPQRSEALRLLERIDAYVQKTQRLPVNQRVTPASAIQAQPVAASAPAVPQSHRSSRVVFQTKVQPILISRCANGACHGQISKNEFRLTNVRLESSNLRVATESNLEVLKNWIDREKPSQSVLLKKPLEETRHHRGLFSGMNRDQYITLQDWVIRYTNELNVSSEPAPPRVAVQQAGGAVSSNPREPGLLPVTKGNALPVHETQAPPALLPAASQELQQARQRLQPDAFDPAQFNRMNKPVGAP